MYARSARPAGGRGAAARPANRSAGFARQNRRRHRLGTPSSVDQPRPKNPCVAGTDNLVATPFIADPRGQSAGELSPWTLAHGPSSSAIPWRIHSMGAVEGRVLV